MKNKRKSFFWFFGMLDVVIMLLLAIYGVYDCQTDVGFWAGIHGAIILLVVEPLLFLLLLIDVIIWYIYRRKKKHDC